MKAVLTTPEARPASVRRDAAHRREEERVERDPAAETDGERRRQDVDEEVPVYRGSCEEDQADVISPSPPISGVLMPKRITSLSESRSEDAPQSTVDGR